MTVRKWGQEIGLKMDRVWLPLSFQCKPELWGTEIRRGPPWLCSDASWMLTYLTEKSGKRLCARSLKAPLILAQLSCWQVAVFTVSRFTENVHSLCNVFTDHSLEIEIIALSQVEGVCCFCVFELLKALGQPSEQERMGANKVSLRAIAAYPDYLFNHL